MEDNREQINQHIPPEIFFVISQFLFVYELNSLSLVSKPLHSVMNSRFLWNLRVDHFPEFYQRIIEDITFEGFVPEEKFYIQDFEVLKLRKMVHLWRTKCLFFMIEYGIRMNLDPKLRNDVDDHVSFLKEIFRVFQENRKSFEDVEFKCYVNDRKSTNKRQLQVVIPYLTSLIDESRRDLRFFGIVEFPTENHLIHLNESNYEYSEGRRRIVRYPGWTPDGSEEESRDIIPTTFTEPDNFSRIRILDSVFDKTVEKKRSLLSLFTWEDLYVDFLKRIFFPFRKSPDQSSFCEEEEKRRSKEIFEYIRKHVDVGPSKHDLTCSQLVVCRGSVQIEESSVNLNSNPIPFHLFTLHAKSISYLERSDDIRNRSNFTSLHHQRLLDRNLSSDEYTTLTFSLLKNVQDLKDSPSHVRLMRKLDICDKWGKEYIHRGTVTASTRTFHPPILSFRLKTLNSQLEERNIFILPTKPATRRFTYDDSHSIPVSEASRFLNPGDEIQMTGRWVGNNIYSEKLDLLSSETVFSWRLFKRVAYGTSMVAAGYGSFLIYLMLTRNAEMRPFIQNFATMWKERFLGGLNEVCQKTTIKITPKSVFKFLFSSKFLNVMVSGGIAVGSQLFQWGCKIFFEIGRYSYVVFFVLLISHALDVFEKEYSPVMVFLRRKFLLKRNKRKKKK